MVMLFFLPVRIATTSAATHMADHDVMLEIPGHSIPEPSETTLGAFDGHGQQTYSDAAGENSGERHQKKYHFLPV
jgi:hypothetical protein